MTYLFEAWNEEAAAAEIAKIEKQHIVLRPYQLKAVDASYGEWNAVRSTLINAATGLGKSVMFSEVMRRWDVSQGKILLIAHRKELIYQAVGHAHKAGLSSAVEMAGKWASGKEDVVIASVATLNASRKCGECFGEGCDSCSDGKIKRFTRFNPRDFGLITIDEGHHAAAKSYRNVLAWFGQNPNQKTLLVTATPKRADKKGLHNVCDSVAFSMDIREGIAEGWLCPIKQVFVTVDGLDISNVDTAKGDLQAGQLETAFLGTSENEERLLHAIAKPTLLEAKGEKVLVFSPGKEHAEKLCAAFVANGAKAAVVVDSTDEKERSFIVDEYKNGDLQVLVNCMCYTEGFDAPETRIVANCRLTKSESLALQILGRGTRTLPGVVDGLATAEERRAAIAASAKPNMLMLDFVGNSGRHKPLSSYDLLAGDTLSPIDLAEAIKVAKSSSEPLALEEALERVKQARKEAQERKERERQQRLSTRTKADRVDYTATDVDLFEGPKFSVNVDGTSPELASEKQQKVLVRQIGMKKADAARMSKKQASAIIGKRFKQVQDNWKGQFAAAKSVDELKHVGEQIAKVKGVDYFLKNPETHEILKQAYIVRRSQLKQQETPF